MIIVHHDEGCAGRPDPNGYLTGACNCNPTSRPNAPTHTDDGQRITYQKFSDLAAEEPPAGSEAPALLAMSPAEKAAHLEFRDAAREARATQESAQKAAKRYAEAVRKLSEVCAPPATIEE